LIPAFPTRRSSDLAAGRRPPLAARSRPGLRLDEIDLVEREDARRREERVDARHELVAGALVLGEPQSPPGAGPRRQVGEDVGIPERIDRLLRIAHEDQAEPGVGLAAKRRRMQAAQDLPLAGIGVLTFVDEDDRVAPPKALGERLAL